MSRRVSDEGFVIKDGSKYLVAVCREASCYGGPEEVYQAAQEVLDALDEAEGVEFPGMYN